MLDVIAYALLVVLLLMLVVYLTRTTAVQRMRAIGSPEHSVDARSQKFNTYLGLLTSTQIVGCNEIEVLFNGDGVFPRLWEDLARAEHAICVHVHFFKPGEVADTLLRILSERAQAGVHVLVLLDAVGAGGLPKDYRHRLTAAGAEAAVYRPFRLGELYKFQQRMHMRAVVIDGRIGFTGGFGIADQWLGDGRTPGRWRDTSVRVEGPVAMQLQMAFSDNWSEATGELLIGDAIAPFAEAPRPAEPKAAGVMICSPSFGTTNAERFFFLAITSARERIYIASAYFVPTRDMRWPLMNAADRGVDVRVLIPGPSTDQPLVWHAGRALYPQLLAAGVRVFDYQPGMMHAKTFVADGCRATIGTFNSDNRSMRLNDEVALIIRDETIAGRLEQSFMADLERAREIQAEALTRGSRLDWAKARFARSIPALL
jgi:cardiolipin synthase